MGLPSVPSGIFAIPVPAGTTRETRTLCGSASPTCLRLSTRSIRSYVYCARSASFIPSITWLNAACGGEAEETVGSPARLTASCRGTPTKAARPARMTATRARKYKSSLLKETLPNFLSLFGFDRVAACCIYKGSLRLRLFCNPHHILEDVLNYCK